MSVTINANVQVQRAGVLKNILQKSHDGIRIILVRHGETDWNQQQRFQGWTNTSLNLEGRRQASDVAEFLKSVKIDYAFGSPLIRARETASIILKHHPSISLNLLDGFKEIHYGEWQGMLKAEVALVEPEKFRQWYSKPSQVKKQGGESLEQFFQRVIFSWKKMLDLVLKAESKSKTVLVVAHDGINKIILSYLCGLDIDSYWQFTQTNCAINLIHYPYEYSENSSHAEIKAFNVNVREGGKVPLAA